MWFWSLRPVKNRFFIDKNRFLAIQVSIRIDTAYQVLSPSLVLPHQFTQEISATACVFEIHAVFRPFDDNTDPWEDESDCPMTLAMYLNGFTKDSAIFSISIMLTGWLLIELQTMLLT